MLDTIASSVRIRGALALLILANIGLRSLHAADSKAVTAEEFDAGKLVEILQKSIGSPINVDLKNGESFVRATLLKLSFDRKKGVIRSLSLQDADTGKSRSVGFVTVRSIRLDRETIYSAPAANPRSAAERRAVKQAEQAAEERTQWVERAKKKGVKPWPELTRQQHEAAVAEHRKLIDEVSKAMPGMAVYETHEFLFFSNIPHDQIAPYTTALDSLHDMMCQMYGIKRGEPVWKGKCLVAAFLTEGEFHRFERTFLQNDDPRGAQGLCHPRRDGRVIISCYRGDDPDHFASLLVHETSHGFIHRYRTPVHAPSWVNEGMAEWISAKLVPKCDTVSIRERNALQTMRQTGSMGGGLFKPEGNIEAWQYGIASSMTDFMIRQDAAAYTRFIQGIKEGLTWQESLQEHYKATPEELIASYGQAIGVPGLGP